MEDLTAVLRRILSGDESSIQEVLSAYQSKTISDTEQTQIEAFLKSQKNHNAIYLRGLLHEYGYGVKQDYDMSFLLMREAAAKGNAKATYEVGKHFLYGLGVEKHYENAFQWLEIAAVSPHYVSDAMYELGRIYEEGLGVSVDLTMAQKWYARAAQKGHVKAQEKVAKE